MLQDMNSTFSGCTSLVALDLSGFNTSRVNTFRNMFKGCNALCSVTLGSGFNCKALANQYGSEYWATLPTPPTTAPNNGLWKITTSNMSYTPAGIQDLTGDDIAGTWIWSEGVAVFVKSGEGGTAIASPLNTGAEDSTVELVATPDEGYVFTCWTLMSGENTGKIASATSATTTFTFGSENGTVAAIFAESGHAFT